MRAGKLRHRVIIERLTATQDAAGQETGTWGTFATRWASLEPLSGRELVNAQQVSAEVTHAITLRYLSGVVPKMRAVFGGRNFDIQSVLNRDERKVELELLVRERV